MSAVTIYTTVACVFCLRAKEYLRSRAVAYEEVDVTGDEAARARLTERANGQRTVPQISWARCTWVATSTWSRWTGKASSVRCWHAPDPWCGVPTPRRVPTFGGMKEEPNDG